MPNLNVNILGRDGNTRAKVTGQEELSVRVDSIGALGLATEATLLDVLAAVDNMRDYEVRLVVDASDVTWLEVRYWDAQDGTLGTPVYYLAGSTTPGSPVLPITYINPNTYLAQIVSNTTGLATELTLGDIKTSVQLIDNCVGVDGITAPTNSFLVAGVTAGGIQQTIEVNASGHVNIADGGGSITVDATSLPLPTGAATETTLGSVDTKLTAAIRIPNFLRPSGSLGTIAAGTFSMSFASVGTADATVGGMILKPGETINFDAGALNNTLGAVAYSTLTAGAELIITTLT
jgi:hypothetical protein